jgi:hypothetical protein
MKFIAKPKAVKADIAKKEITISFTLDMGDEELAEAAELATYTDADAGDVEIIITPRQYGMFVGKSARSAVPAASS